MSAIGLSVNINDTNELMKHIDELVIKFENSEECFNANQKYSECIEEIKEFLPEDKGDLLRKLDDIITEMLVLYEEHFYKCGYYDSRKSQCVLKRIILWFVGRK